MATVYSKLGRGNDMTNERVAMGTVDIASLGARAASDVIYTGCRVPEGAIVTEVKWFVTTVCTGDGSSAGTWLMGFDSDSGINNVQAATAMTTCGVAGIHYSPLLSEDGYDGNDAATDTAIEKVALRRAAVFHSTQAGGDELVITLAGQTWAAGKVTFFAKYIATKDLA